LAGIEIVDGAKAVAFGASAVSGVEAETSRLKFRRVDAALRAGHGGAEQGFGRLAVGCLEADEYKAVGQLQCARPRGGEPASVILRAAAEGRPAAGIGGNRLQNDAVNDGFEGV